MEKRVGVVVCLMDILADKLEMDPRHKIIDVVCDWQDRQRGQVRLVIEGPNMPMVPDEMDIPWVGLP
jgi:hypothetical protein